MGLIAFTLMLANPAVEVPLQGKPTIAQSKSCREMLLSSSRLGLVKICKTRAEWRRFDDCHRSVTRYCTPRKDDVAIAQALDRIDCRTVRKTGSRIAQQRICATRKEWKEAEKMTQEAVEGVQGQNSLVGTQTIFRNRKDLSEPQ